MQYTKIFSIQQYKYIIFQEQQKLLMDLEEKYMNRLLMLIRSDPEGRWCDITMINHTIIAYCGEGYEPQRKCQANCCISCWNICRNQKHLWRSHLKSPSGQNIPSFRCYSKKNLLMVSLVPVARKLVHRVLTNTLYQINHWTTTFSEHSWCAINVLLVICKHL